MNLMFGNTISMGAKSLEFLWAKQKVISENMTNIDTPNYKAKYVTFEDEFRNRLQLARATGSNQSTRDIIENSHYTVHVKENSSDRLDRNNVDADTEEVEATRAYLQYQYVLQAVNNDITRLRTVIKG